VALPPNPGGSRSIGSWVDVFVAVVLPGANRGSVVLPPIPGGSRSTGSWADVFVDDVLPGARAVALPTRPGNSRSAGTCDTEIVALPGKAVAFPARMSWMADAPRPGGGGDAVGDASEPAAGDPGSAGAFQWAQSRADRGAHSRRCCQAGVGSRRRLKAVRRVQQGP
jgi:hypothetical protein